MRAVRRSILLSLLLGAWVSCTEDIAAPGTCPEFCPDAEIEVRDTLLTNLVERDSSYFGYVAGYLGKVMPVTSAGAAVASHGAVEFQAFPEDILFNSVGGRADIISTDSFRVDLRMLDRNESISGLEILLYTLPIGIDSSTTFAEVDSVVAAGALLGVVAVPDTLERDSTATSDSVAVSFPASSLPTFEDDERRVAMAISVRGAGGPTFAEFGTAEGALSARLTRFATVDSSGTEVVRSEVRGVAFDTFLSDSGPPVAADELVAGRTPSARALLRFIMPSSIIDSATVVGATLYLVPVAPTLGAPQDTFELQANALSADFGAKSPIVLITSSAQDTVTAPVTDVPVGTMDTIAIDVTPILRNWQATSRPHSMIIRVSPEGGSLGAVLFGGSRHPTGAPSLRVTYVNPFRFEGR